MHTEHSSTISNYHFLIRISLEGECILIEDVFPLFQIIRFSLKSQYVTILSLYLECLGMVSILLNPNLTTIKWMIYILLFNLHINRVFTQKNMQSQRHIKDIPQCIKYFRFWLVFGVFLSRSFLWGP